MSIRYVFVCCLIVAGASAYLTKRYLQCGTLTETEKNVTKTHEVVAPDGSRVIDTVTHETKNTVVVAPAAIRPDWFVNLGVAYNFDRQGQPIYNLGVNKRLIGPIFVGGSVSSDRSLGVGIGIEF